MSTVCKTVVAPTCLTVLQTVVVPTCLTVLKTVVVPTCLTVLKTVVVLTCSTVCKDCHGLTSCQSINVVCFSNEDTDYVEATERHVVSETDAQRQDSYM